MNEEFDLIPISILNQYDYCPRRCWLICVAGEFLQNPYTVEGELIHERAHQGSDKIHEDLIQLRHVHVYSRRLGLIGYADVVEEKDGELYPVEYKRGRKGEWQNDQLQLCAQAMCLEEMTGQPAPQGALFYAQTKRRVTVPFDAGLRDLTESTAAELAEVFASLVTPPPTPHKSRCRACSLIDLCRPEAVSRPVRAWRDRMLDRALQPGADT